jgi:spore germination cell wall hydrolase CwlJ-like protein
MHAPTMNLTMDIAIDRRRAFWPNLGSIELWAFLAVFAFAASGLIAVIASTRDNGSFHGGIAPRAPLSTMPVALGASAPPIVAPVAYADLPPQDARASNAAVPLVAGRIAPAPAFLFEGTPSDRSAAETCLAAAVWYEAGDDPDGERAVAQVVLNRVRHPAFPKTICGVVFQGSERSTGCQFTFACDGSLTRKPGQDAWERAKAIADTALRGIVYKPVGTATHYHTDWVVPYWRDSLDKIAVVHTQIFYRWKGGWGLPRTFTGHLQPLEILDARLVGLAGPEQLALRGGTSDQTTSVGSAPAPAELASLAIEGVSDADLKGNVVRLMDAGTAHYVLQLDPTAFPGSYALVAYMICKDKPDCLVMGWRSPDMLPRALPTLTTGMRGMSFLFQKSSASKSEKPYWNCQQMARRDPAECLPETS